MTEFKTKSGMFSRRGLLKAGAAAGAVGVASPWIIRGSMASSGELNFIGWAGYDEFPAVFKAFEAKTGIKVNFLEQPDQDSMVAQCEHRRCHERRPPTWSSPPSTASRAWIDNDIIQPWDEKQDRSSRAWTRPSCHGRRREHGACSRASASARPRCGAREALTIRAKEAPIRNIGKAKLARPVRSEVSRARSTLRAHSSLAAMAACSIRRASCRKPWIESYKDEATMAANSGDIALAEAIKHKANVVQFWNGENDAQAAFRTNGCTLGLTWDSTGQRCMKDKLALRLRRPEGRRIRLAPGLSC